jgi:ATP-dependent Clp protease ATP-binding subunit ClpA
MTMFERFARDARAAVVLGQEEARELGDRAMGPEHLLVGVLQSAGRDLAAVLTGYGLTVDAIRARVLDAGRRDDSFDDFSDGETEALKSIGIDLKTVRDNVIRTFGADAFDDALRRSGRRGRRRGQIPLDRAAKKVLESALREAMTHKDRTLECEHLLLGILRGGDRYTLGIITEHVDSTQLRDAVIALLDQAA